MPTNHADHTAANTAGFKRTQLDRGASFGANRYVTTYEKHVVGEPGSAGGTIRHQAVSGISQADADSKALSAVNQWRNLRYGFAAAGGSKGPKAMTALTVDLH